MIKIYHNPRCRKSREGVALLEASGKKYTIVTYLTDTISYEELKKIIILLNINPIQLVRKNETLWKANYKGLTLNNNEIIKIMVKHPKLIERPIVLNKDKAVIARPSNLIKTII